MPSLKNNLAPSVIIFISSLILIYLAFFISRYIKNNFILAVIISIFILVIFIIYNFLYSVESPEITGKSALRYTMHCKNCNWEWMSNTTEKGAPNVCPNCHEKFNLEVIGWRKVKLTPKKSERDLRSFI